MRSLITFFSILLASSSYGSFSETHVRFLGPADLISVLVRHFPEVAAKYHDNNCFAFRRGNAIEWGTVQPSLGTPVYKRPSSAFINAFSDCLALSFDFYQQVNLDPEIAKAYIQRWWPQDLIEKKGLKQSLEFKDLLNSPSTGLKNDERLNIIRFLIFKLIGPEDVLLDFSYVKSQNELEQRILQGSAIEKGNIGSWLNFVITIVMSRDEFLRY